MKPRARCRKGGSGVTLILAAVPIFALFAGLACSRRGQEPASLRPMSQPDLSRVSESVKAQLQDAYASLALTTEDRDANTPLRSDAYGRLGMLLMAAAFLDEAQACFLNVESLSPGEVRWPSYLGPLPTATG